MYYVYFLKNTSKDSIYIGYTNDLEKRFKEHKDKRPELLYYEAYRDEKDARNRERMLKQRGQSIRWLKSRLINSLK